MDYKKIAKLKKKLDSIHKEKNYFLIFYPSTSMDGSKTFRIKAVTNLLNEDMPPETNSYFIDSKGQEAEIKTILKNVPIMSLVKVKNYKIIEIFPLEPDILNALF